MRGSKLMRIYAQLKSGTHICVLENTYAYMRAIQ
jgi:hypothetical protein